jgi:UDP-glucuronate 4-epimerase
MAPPPRPILVTGAAGFIGFHTCQRLLAAGAAVVGLDNLNAYYPVALKEARLAELRDRPGFRFEKADLADAETIRSLFDEHRFERVVHLGAQAGVRYSIENPRAYGHANLTGFLNVLEGCRSVGSRHLVFASSSSVYGLNAKTPFSEADNTDHPVSLYAATKKANEAMAHAYAHLYGLPVTGLRFFTVYGPWGRPEMAVWLFTEAILAGRPIRLFNDGDMKRDFTYVDDIVDGVVRLLDAPPGPDAAFDRASPDPGRSSAPYRILNIGNNRPVELARLVDEIERATGVAALREYHPMQPGDVHQTYADIERIAGLVGFAPSTDLRVGIERFVRWYRAYRGRPGA